MKARFDRGNLSIYGRFIKNGFLAVQNGIVIYRLSMRQIFLGKLVKNIEHFSSSSSVHTQPICMS